LSLSERRSIRDPGSVGWTKRTVTIVTMSRLPEAAVHTPLLSGYVDATAVWTPRAQALARLPGSHSVTVTGEVKDGHSYPRHTGSHGRPKRRRPATPPRTPRSTTAKEKLRERQGGDLVGAGDPLAADAGGTGRTGLSPTTTRETVCPGMWRIRLEPVGDAPPSRALFDGSSARTRS
jgi:hypothetical protein